MYEYKIVLEIKAEEQLQIINNIKEAIGFSKICTQQSLTILSIIMLGDPRVEITEIIEQEV